MASFYTTVDFMGHLLHTCVHTRYVYSCSDYSKITYETIVLDTGFFSLQENQKLKQNGDEFVQGTSDEAEASALENVMFRLRLILAEEERQDYPAAESSFETPLNDPW